MERWERWNIRWSCSSTRLAREPRPAKAAWTRLAAASLLKLVSCQGRRTRTHQHPLAAGYQLCNFDISEIRLWMEGYKDVCAEPSKTWPFWSSLLVWTHTDASEGQCDNAKLHLDLVWVTADQNHFHLNKSSSRQDKGRQSDEDEDAKVDCSQGLAIYSNGN